MKKQLLGTILISSLLLNQPVALATEILLPDMMNEVSVEQVADTNADSLELETESTVDAVSEEKQVETTEEVGTTQESIEASLEVPNVIDQLTEEDNQTEEDITPIEVPELVELQKETKEATTKGLIASGTLTGGTWELSEDYVLTISGGEIDQTPEWDTYKASIKTIVIQEELILNFYGIFKGYSELVTIEGKTTLGTDLKNISTMFYNCRKLTSVDISGWDTSDVTKMELVFNNCESLVTLDVSSFDTSKVTTMNSMFYSCSSLVTLDVSGFDTSKVTTMERMFYGCESLVTLELNGWDTSNVTSMKIMFKACSSLVMLDVSDFDTSKVTTMEDMFNACRSLVTLDLSSFDTSNVTVMATMFYGCRSLVTLDVSGFDTSKVTAMHSMFSYCRSLVTLNVSGFDTSNVKNMSLMFMECINLEKLDVTSWKTNNVTGMGFMFNSCYSLAELDVSGWETGNVISMQNMFYRCESLVELNVSGWDTSNVNNMESVFSSCYSLAELDVSDWNTSKVASTSSMFSGCKNLKFLDLSSWDMSNRPNTRGMFTATNGLQCLKLGEKFNFIENNAGLGKPAPLEEMPADRLSGNWIREDGQSIGYSPIDFMTNYGTGDLTAGTYIAEVLPALSVLEGHVTFTSNTTPVTIGDMTTMSLTIKHMKDSIADSAASAIKLTVDDLLSSVSAEFNDSITLTHYSDKDVVLEETTVASFAELNVPDLPYGEYVVIKTEGQVWNNSLPDEDNYNMTVSYHDGEATQTQAIAGNLEILSGSLNFTKVPDVIEYQTTPLSFYFGKHLIDRETDDLSLMINDLRGTNTPKGTEEVRMDWEVVATSTAFKYASNQVVPQSSLVNVFVKDGVMTELSETDEVLLTTHQVAGETPKENRETTVNWEKEEGLKALVKNRAGLSKNTNYQADVTFELRTAP